MGINNLYLTGRLTREPELRYTPNGSAVCRISIAVNRRYKGSDGEFREETCYVDIDVWSKLAEWCASHTRKGSEVMVQGRLKNDTWEDRNTGQKRSKLLVTAESIRSIQNSETRRNDTIPKGETANQQERVDDRDVPSLNPPVAPAPRPDFEPVTGTDDSIPF